ncbi:MAG TPA: substrate-binding domain-containing protein [Chthonomonadaceae bacterium]|nr:substrate-binding domain-containing protein [Chthonomonadaceae bacterium]
MTQRRCAIFLAVLGALAVWGCGPKDNPPAAGSGGGTSAPAAGGKTFVIGMSQCTVDEPWRVQMDQDIQDAAAKHPELKLLVSVAGDNSATQQQDVRTFVQQKVNLIIISPKESRPLTKPVEEAMDAGIPVIVLDRKIEGDKYTCFIGGDNVKIGREAGKYMVQLLGGKGNVVELKGLMTSTPAQERHNGFMEGIKGSKIQIVFDAESKWKQDIAQKDMSSALQTKPQIDAVYAHNDPSAHGAYLAARTEGKGREKQIKFIGIDALPSEGVRLVREGVLTATFQYPTGGKEAIDTALKVLHGEKVDKNITLGTRIFTHDNVSQGGKEL